MDLKSLIQKERKMKPPRIILHGIHKIGKSTFGAGSPSPLFLLTEDGLTTIDVPSFPLAKSFDDVENYLGAVIADNSNDFQTLVVDTIDWLEKIIWKQVCIDNQVDSIEKIGYSKGYTFAMKYWAIFFRGIDAIREKGLAIILLAHNEIKTYNPPDGQPYDRYQIKLHRLAAARAEEWADAILFANYETYVSEKKATGGRRIIYTSPNPAYVAGNRYNLPKTINMDFNELMEGIKNG